MADIHHIVEYHPHYLVKNNPNWREQYPDTWRILDFKENQPYAIQYYQNLVISALNDNLQLGSHWGVAVVPSSQRDSWGAGLCQIANALHTEHEVSLYIQALRRHQNIEKLSGGGDRAIERHFGTIALNSTQLPENMILLDDVTSTGNSLRACERILQDAGVQNIYLIAIGETSYGTP